MKVATTERLTSVVSEHWTVPVQAPDQPAKVEPAAGVAVRVTGVPLLKLDEQTAPQLIPAGLLVTVPLPVPALVTVSDFCVGGGVLVKVSVTVRFADINREHWLAVPAKAQSPPQPPNVEPPSAAAVNVTD